MLNKLKRAAIATLTCCTLSLPLSAQADLIIDNQTFFPSTCKINNQKGNAQCSNTIPIYGVTQAHSKNTIPQGIIWGGCLANLHDCTAEVYMTDNCTGPIVATAVFDINSGIKSLVNTAGSNFVLSDRRPQNAFYIDIMGGPAP